VKNVDVLGLPMGIFPPQKNGGTGDVTFRITVGRQQAQQTLFEIA